MLQRERKEADLDCMRILKKVKQYEIKVALTKL